MSAVTISSTQVTTDVWAAASRTLTSFLNAIITGGQAQTNISAGVSIQFRPNATNIWDVTFSGDNVNVQIALYDGTNTFIGTDTLANSSKAFVGVTNSIYINLKNADGSNPHHYMYCAKIYTVS